MYLFDSVLWWQLVTLVFVFGVIIGSFLNVYIYRFHTGKSLVGSSHCLSCQTPLRWYELFPLLSYLGLRGRCRTCSSYIPVRYWLVEGLTGVLFVAVLFIEPLVYYWPLWWLFMALLVVVAVYDLYHLIIPNRFVVYLSIVSLIIFLGNWWLLPSWWVVGDHVLAAMVGFGFFAGLWWYSGGRWIGFGDAKLALPLAFTLGTVPTISMIVYAFWIGTIISVLLLLVAKMRGQRHLRFLSLPRTMKSEVPFAPFLILGFLTVWFFTIDVLTLTNYAFLWWL